MRKKLGVIAAAVICVIAMGVPVYAKTSPLDVKAGDTYSFWTQKDGGSDWDNYFYVTPTSYYGTVHAFCSAQTDRVTSPTYVISHTTSRYSYVDYAAPGKFYRLYTYGSPSGWHLIGRFTS